MSGFVPSAVSRFERRFIPKPVLRKLPWYLRPTELTATFQRKRTRARLYWKFDSNREIQLYGAVFMIIAVNFWIQFRTPIDHFLALPSSDPNKFLKDPYSVREINEQRQRQLELKERIVVEGDDHLARALAGYTNTTSVLQPQTGAALPPAPSS